MNNLQLWQEYTQNLDSEERRYANALFLGMATNYMTLEDLESCIRLVDKIMKEDFHGRHEASA
jgi:hypothetical protein